MTGDGTVAPELAAAMAETRHYRERITALAAELEREAEQAQAKRRDLGADLDMGRAAAYRDCARRLRAVLGGA